MNWVCSCILHVSCRSSSKGFVLQPTAGMIVIMAEIYGRDTKEEKICCSPTAIRTSANNPYGSVSHNVGGLLKQDGLSRPRKVPSADFIY